MMCKFIKPDGASCQANATDGSEYCFSHNPEYSEQKQLAVIKGGLNRKHYEAYGDRIEINTPLDVKKMLAEVINGVWTGKIPSNQPANTIGFLSRCWLDANEQSDIVNRIETVEKLLEEIKKRN